ncbi:hypothetical protein OROHE_023760 [Orobanche hederae]
MGEKRGAQTELDTVGRRATHCIIEGTYYSRLEIRQRLSRRLPCKLEEALKKSFPRTNLKGNPHINSKPCAWKKSYYSLSTILNRSGVGFNSRGNYQIECENEAWDQIVKLDPNTRLMRYKSWPYYDSWQEIFGKDRANGEAAEDIPDAYHAMSNDEMYLAGGRSANFEFNLDDIPDKEGEGGSAAQT